jgi:hypothetical protein
MSPTISDIAANPERASYLIQRKPDGGQIARRARIGYIAIKRLLEKAIFPPFFAMEIPVSSYLHPPRGLNAFSAKTVYIPAVQVFEHCSRQPAGEWLTSHNSHRSYAGGSRSSPPSA